MKTYSPAPTASTTAALAVGDAIAVTLMKMKKHWPRRFRSPSSGRTAWPALALTVGDVMRKDKEKSDYCQRSSCRGNDCPDYAFLGGAISWSTAGETFWVWSPDYDIRRRWHRKKAIASMKSWRL